MKKIAIIIPTFNELDNIEDLINKISKNIPESSIFIIDDTKDPDIGNLITLKNLKAKYFHRENAKGRGSAVLFGLNEALKENKFDIFVEMDADFSHNPDELRKNIEKIIKSDLLVFDNVIKEISKNNRSRSAKLRYAIRSKNKFSYPHELIEKFKNYLNLEAINV